ncbi:MAG: type III secretion system export apparatus subunit SctV [Rhodospirillaceae bacterium]
MSHLKSMFVALSRRNDIALALVLMAVVFMMIIPLPPPILDALLAISIGSSILLLMVAVYLQSPLDLSAFPGILLITTVYRLSLAISTTRQILLQADAGQIIFTFGNFVVAGNLIVGLVIFLIITIVQFMVITKGSERVAEVGARFSLDAMPGKQMSIDGDMRAGVIDVEEARRRRSLVEKESQLFGSMDGAMKFVKGDAMASLIITAINILGGIGIGVLQRGMSAAVALQTYSILTIGVGLVGQIPSLLTSIAAGIIVTRVTSDDPTNLGDDIGRQLTAEPKALMIGGLIMVVFAAIPGMPVFHFLVLAGMIGGLGFGLARVNRQAIEAVPATGLQAIARMPAATPAAPAGRSTGRPAGKKPVAETEEFALTIPVMIDLAAELQDILHADVLNDELIKVRRALYFDLGVPFPGIHLRFNDHLADSAYSILLQEIPMSQGRLKPGYLFVREEPGNLSILGVPFVEDKPFLPNMPTIWVAAKYRDVLNNGHISFMEEPQILTYHVSILIKRYAQDFIGIQETRFLLERMEARFPELVKEVQRTLPIQKLTEILQRLVSEDVSIRNLRVILESLIEWSQREKDTVLLTEYTRGTLRRYISYKYSTGHNILPAYLLTPDVEDTVRNAVRQTSSGSYLALDPAVSRKLVDKIKKAVGDITHQRQKPVLLASMDIRRYLRRLIEMDLYELPVLSYQELTQEITIQPLARIDLK